MSPIPSTLSAPSYRFPPYLRPATPSASHASGPARAADADAYTLEASRRATRGWAAAPAPDPYAQRDIVKTFAWATAGLGATLGSAWLGAACVPPLTGAAAVVGGIGLGLGIVSSCFALFGERPITRGIGWVGLHGALGLSLSGLALVPMPILLAAGAATLGTSAVLTGVAWLVPVDTFTSWRGPVLGAMSGLVVASALTLAFPQVYAVQQALTYVGLATFGASTLVDTADLRMHAGEPGFSPLQHGVKLTLNAVNLFVRIVSILAENQNRRR